MTSIPARALAEPPVTVAFGSFGEICTPAPGIPNTHCSAYAANSGTGLLFFDQYHIHVTNQLS